jgi:hypothetical protein
MRCRSPAAQGTRAAILALGAVCLFADPSAPAWPQATSQAPRAQQAPAGAAAQKRPAAAPLKVRYGTEGLPRTVLDVREALLAAIEAGDIEELRQAFETGERRPDVGAPAKTDPIAHLKGLSGDGQGREVLAILSLLLDAGYVAVPRGPDIENNRHYVWPYFAEVPLARLTPRQEVELMRLVPAAAAREMKEKGRYTHWRLVIGADGTWHALRKDE